MFSRIYREYDKNLRNENRPESASVTDYRPAIASSYSSRDQVHELVAPVEHADETLKIS